MNNNDKEKGSLGPSEELEELLKRYAIQNSQGDQEPKSAKGSKSNQPRKTREVSFSFDDDLNVPNFKPQVKAKTNEHTKDENAPRYKGEVYFSSRPNTNNSRQKPVQNQQMNRPKGNRPQANPPQGNRPNAQKAKAKMSSQGKKVVMIYLAIILAISISLSFWAMSCLNDIFAFNKKSESVTITIPRDASTGKVLGILHDEGLIKNSIFCRFFMNVTLGMRDAQPKYLPGVYYVKGDIGVEKMLTVFQETREAKTVTVSFPEGWTVDKMAQKLMKNGVCTEKAFYENLDKAMFEYGFVKDVKNKKDRYHTLEGYLFPDTYEFFIGQNPSSVIDNMLKRFSKEWTPQYAARAKELGMTVDEVITLASMIQKEAGNADQMKYISSVFHNRLKNPANFPSLQSDATAAYVTNCVRYGIESSEYDAYLFRYNTYNLTGLPVGAICNPGSKAIEAALYPAQTDYFYFCHNTNTKEIYLAKTLVEHNKNKIKAELTPVEEEQP